MGFRKLPERIKAREIMGMAGCREGVGAYPVVLNASFYHLLFQLPECTGNTSVVFLARLPQAHSPFLCPFKVVLRIVKKIKIDGIKIETRKTPVELVF